MQSSEQALIALAVGGDEQALADLLHLAAPSLRERLAGRIPKRLQSLLSEDDIMQQSYVDAFLGIRKFVPQDSHSFVAWLWTLTQRNLTDAIRMLEAVKRGRNHRRINVDEDRSLTALYEILEADSVTPSRLAATQEGRSALRIAIGALPELYRQVVQLYDLEGQTIQEVATVVKRSVGAVFMLRARAHGRLRELMGSASKFLSAGA